MGYLYSIETSFFCFPFLAILFTVPFLVHQYRKYGAVSLFRGFIIYSFILYLLTIYFLVILPLPNKEEVRYMPNMIRLIPFSFVRDILLESTFVWNDFSTYFTSLLDPCFYTVLFNVFMMIPFGMYLRYYFLCDVKKTCFYTFCFSLFLELTQLTGLYFIYPYPYRVFDVDDLIVNTFGGFLGYYFVGGFLKFLPSRDSIDQKAFLKGKTVSGLRRIFIFVFDFLLYLFLVFLFHSFFLEKTAILVFLFYYVFIPYMSGSTIFGKFLKVEFYYSRYKLFFIFIRNIFLFFYYILLPPFFLWALYKVTIFFHLSFLVFLFLFILFFFLIFLFYLVSIFFLIKRKKMFYDSWFSLTFISTISSK